MNCEHLFDFRETEGGCELSYYFYRSDPNITELELPAEHNGRPLVSIADIVFSNAAYIKRITIPESVRTIGSGTFAKCRSLTEIALSPLIEKIPDSAFRDCTSLEEITLPNVRRIEREAFSRCENLRRVTAPKLEMIADGHDMNDGAFAVRDALETLECDINAVYVGKFAFSASQKIPAKLAMLSLIPGRDITKPFPAPELDKYFDFVTAFRLDVLELAIKYNSFRKFTDEQLFSPLPYYPNAAAIFSMLESGGRSPDLQTTDEMLDVCAERNKTEMTACLLDYKRRKFGFDGGKKFTL